MFKGLKLHILPLNATHRTHTSNTWLDLSIVTNEDKVVNYGQLEAPGLSHHDPIYLSYCLRSSEFAPKLISYRDIKNIKTEKLLSAAECLPWQYVATTATVDEKVDVFNKLVLNLYDGLAPVVNKHATRAPAPWLAQEIWEIIARCNVEQLRCMGAMPTKHTGSKAIQQQCKPDNISVLEANRTIMHIKSRAKGNDEISIKLICLILPVILSTLTDIFNASITSPLSILPCLTKAFEYIIHGHIVSHINEDNLLDNFQSGFRRQHSTIAFTNITEDIRRALNSRQLTLLTIIDFSKALDSVDHDILLAKLSSYFNFSLSICECIQSYLCDRYQCVIMNNTKSQWHAVF
ncbi:hypothetical protein PR048_001749 [Dryococelus australis]|uniref:Reverse transcriptase domain-containing protein n=1 Tax=Dryococelus australis TaxID=614101 RepID=A0ABQ9II81_9NEOP|nr:hypothetical protein PR048_001749 [Dryococelus australis]